MSGTDAIARLRSDAAALATKVGALQAALAGVPGLLPAEVPATAASSLKELGASVEGDLRGLAAFVAADVSRLLGIGDDYGSVNASLLEFAEKVRKLDLASLPASTEFELSSVGPRNAGDRVVLRIAVGTPGRDAETVETRELRPYQVLQHSRSFVLPIFPYLSPEAGKGARFGVAPAYGYVFERGSRASVERNRLAWFGLGLNLAYLDVPRGRDRRDGAQRPPADRIRPLAQPA